MNEDTGQQDLAVIAVLYLCFFHMFFTVLTRRASHIPFEDLSIISRCGEACHACDLCDAFSFPKKRKAVLDPQEQDVFKNCHFHIFLKESAAFALADIDRKSVV